MAKKQKASNFYIEEITKEHQLNKILREQKINKNRIGLLFTSLWDDNCKRLVGKLGSKYKTGETPLYIINSYDTPHSFVIFDLKTAPALVFLDGDEIQKETYIPNIWHKLKI